mgnify:CR=1 FL=1
MKPWILPTSIIIAALIVAFYTAHPEPTAENSPILHPSPDVWVGPECPTYIEPEPRIITVPTERVVEKIVYVTNPLKTGCHVDQESGKVYGVVETDSQYRLECYLNQDGSVRANYIDVRGTFYRP